MFVRRFVRCLNLVVVCCLAWNVCPAVAVDYDDFPPELQTILNERLAALTSAGGICLAGRVTLSDGAYIGSGADVQVNLYHGIDEPTRMYADGWFIMARTASRYYSGANKHLVVRAFGYDPIDAYVTILADQMTYLDFYVMKTPSANLASVYGTVTDEDDYPFFGARVSVYFPYANFGSNSQGYSFPHMEFTTGSDGRYEFDGLSSCEHTLVAWAAGYAYHYETFTPLPGGAALQNRRLYPNRRIVIDYVYQPDGSRSFTQGSPRSGQISWLNGPDGVDFSQGRVEGYESGSLRDIEMLQTQDVLTFDIFYQNGSNGFYDAGAIGFDSLTQASTSGYTTSGKPCLVGHVYVVKTYELHYAKFIVRSDEMSFRTVVPGDPEPIAFAGYGLTIDFSYSGGYGKVYVEQHLGAPANLGAPALPYYWSVSGMTGIPFTAGLMIAYREADLINMRMDEESLVILRSLDSGQHWYEMESAVDTAANTVEAEGLTSFGRFAVADLSGASPGDVDNDGDIDLRDFGRVQRCYGGADRAITNVGCVRTAMDADLDVDLDDLASFGFCMNGPGMPIDPSCAQ